MQNEILLMYWINLTLSSVGKKMEPGNVMM